jgi:hypothetical protein
MLQLQGFVMQGRCIQGKSFGLRNRRNQLPAFDKPRQNTHVVFRIATMPWF